jgi:hypothetical protein
MYAEQFRVHPAFKMWKGSLPAGISMLMPQKNVRTLLGNPTSSGIESPMYNEYSHIRDFYDFGDGSFYLYYNGESELVCTRIVINKLKSERNDDMYFTYPLLCERPQIAKPSDLYADKTPAFKKWVEILLFALHNNV